MMKTRLKRLEECQATRPPQLQVVTEQELEQMDVFALHDLYFDLISEHPRYRMELDHEKLKSTWEAAGYPEITP